MALAVAAIGGSLIRYGRTERQRGWVWGGAAIILIWDGSIVFVLIRYAMETARGG